MLTTSMLEKRPYLMGHAYTQNLATLKQYGTSRYKLTLMSCVANAGIERPYVKKNSVNISKLENNICRARSKVLEYGFCNSWEYFITFTLRPGDYDRNDLEAFAKKFTQWLRDMRKTTGAPLRYLLVPEQHKKGGWHLHGLFAGLPGDALQPFKASERLPVALRDKLLNGETVYNWPAYAKKFGYVVAEPLRDKDRAVSYLNKYITKDLARSVQQLGAHLYYACQRLSHAQELKRGRLNRPVCPDYQNEYCSISWFDYNEVSVQTLMDLIDAPNEGGYSPYDFTGRI